MQGTRNLSIPKVDSIGANPSRNNLATRFLNGLESNKYRTADYEEMKRKANDLKFKANNSLVKLKKIEKAAKDTKERGLLQQHHAVWSKELLQIQALVKKRTVAAELLIQHGCSSDECCYLFDEISNFSSHLDAASSEFKKNTVDPIWEFREDLKFWLMQLAAKLKSKVPVDQHSLGNPNEIMETLKSIKNQQQDVINKLNNERNILEEELKAFMSGDLKIQTEKPTKMGIPQEALLLECPDDELKVAVLQQFLLIDQKYCERLESLDESNSSLKRNKSGGWDEPEHLQFKWILDQYPHEMPNRRLLCIDRLRKQWPKMTRAELVEHMEWISKMKNYKRRRQSLLHDWNHDRKDLLMKVEAIFEEAVIENRMRSAEELRMKQQKELCHVLFEKVQKWREERLEAMMIRQRLIEEELRETEKLEEEQEEKKRQQRLKDKEKIQERHEKMDADRKRMMDLDMKRLEEIQKRHAEQAVIDAERVKYRETLLVQKLVEQQKKKDEEAQKLEEKEARLEALRETVRVVAEADPYRLIKDTENWQHRTHPSIQEDSNINQPLFAIHTYNSGQITSDPRVKVENRLREAGLHNTDYGRFIISKIQPAKPPRKDTAHTFKLGEL